jgi:hypothetical protein
MLQIAGQFCERYGIWIILGLFAFGGMFGLTYHFGFPIAVNDESPPMAAALKMIAEQSLRANYPSFYYMPLSAYLVLPFVGGGLGAAYLFGDMHSLATLEQFVILDFAKLLPSVRIASLVYGLLCIFLLYRMVTMLYASRRLALVSAWFFATSLMMVQMSHVGRVWTMEVCMMLISLFFVARIWKSERGSMIDYVGAAIGAALAFGVNIIGLVVFTALVVVHVQKARSSRWWMTFWDKRFVASCGVLLFSFPILYLLNPYGFANLTRYAAKFFGISSPPVSSLQAGATSGEGALYYLGILFEYDPLLVLFALVGVYAFVRASRGAALWLLIYGGVYLAAITTLSFAHTTVFEPRYALPLYPVLVLIAAFGFRELFRRVHHPVFRLSALLFVVCVSLIVPLLWLSRFTLPPTRVMALDWVRTHVPDGNSLITTDDRIPFPENLASIERVASDTPHYMTKKRIWLRTHEGAIEHPAFIVSYTSYFSGTSTSSPQAYQYVLLSWWNPEDRGERLRELDRHVGDIPLDHVARFPAHATDETESLDLPNNMRFPAQKLWSIHQNGPVVDVYRVVLE